ncbi:MAG: glycosyltransferase family 4 protein [Limnobacter sp.]|uniref:glycosyltransferase family 4 protein n=1 Tax=Limnobacter sp. TaxID=2003368 RepID=UPI00300272DB
MINDVVKALVKQGHQVVVATGKPNYPDGNIFPGYRANGVQRELFDEQTLIVRVPTWPRKHGGAKNLILNYLVFVLAGMFCLPWALRGLKFDAILVYAPSPITQTIPAILLKWIKRAPLALWVQDLWPESLQATGFVRNKKALTAVGYMVYWIYKGCDLLLAQSKAFIAPLNEYANLSKICYQPNSFPEQSTEALVDGPAALLATLENRFCVVFAGNLGQVQALDCVIDAAELLKDHPDISIVLVGSGSKSEWLAQQKRERGLDNLELPGRFPMQTMPSIFNRAGALLVSLEDDPIFELTIPSKVQAYLAAGKPVLASLNGEGAQVVLEAKAGLASPAGDSAALAANILKIKQMPSDERDTLGRQGKSYFLEYFETESQARHLAETLSAMGKGKK